MFQITFHPGFVGGVLFLFTADTLTITAASILWIKVMCANWCDVYEISKSVSSRHDCHTQKGISCGPGNFVISHTQQDNTGSKWNEKYIFLLSQKALVISCWGGGTTLKDSNFRGLLRNVLVENIWEDWPGVHGNWVYYSNVTHLKLMWLPFFCKSRIIHFVRNWQYPMWGIVMFHSHKYACNRKNVSAGVIDTTTAVGNVSWTFHFLFTTQTVKGVSLVQLCRMAYLSEQ